MFSKINPRHNALKFDIYSSSSSGLDLFIHKETGVLVCFEDEIAYFQGIVYTERQYTEKELEIIKDWLVARDIKFNFYRYKVCRDVLRNAKIQAAFEPDSDDSEGEY